jgi:hypothetical protein
MCDLLVRRKQQPARQSTNVSDFTKKGTDPEKCRDHIFNTTDMVPATHMRLTLEILKRLNDFDFVKSREII